MLPSDRRYSFYDFKVLNAISFFIVLLNPRQNQSVVVNDAVSYQSRALAP